MSYNDESDLQPTRHDGGADPTEAYQATAEWDPISEDQAWARGAEDESWDEESDQTWHDGPRQERWEQAGADGEQWDGEPDEASGGVAGAKQTISAATGKITRWFSGLDRRPEYEDHFQGGDPVAEVDPAADYADAEIDPDSDYADAPLEPAAPGGRRAAAERAIAANRRRSVAATRDGGRTGPGGPFSRGSAHAARTLRGARDRYVVAPDPILEEDPIAEPLPELMGGDGSAPFAVTPLGYNRQAVDERLAELESELTELRASRSQAPAVEPPMSIQEELERIGEETASILVVAHDKAHETTRMAQEQAERCISEAAATAAAITEEAQAKLRELDGETDIVRRRRERLIADARNVAASLVSLADEAEQRFPDDEPAAAPPPSDLGSDAEPAGSEEEQLVEGMTTAFRPQ